MNDNLDTMLGQDKPALSPAERAAMFQMIEAGVAAPVLSPYRVFLHSRSFVTMLLVFAVTLGAAGTVAASESAKPGDTLFPLERLTEQTRLVLARDSHRGELEKQFTAERLAELKMIIDEEARGRIENSETAEDEAFVTVDGKGEARINEAVNVLFEYLNAIENSDDHAKLLKELSDEVASVKVKDRKDGALNMWASDVRLRIKDDRVEIRNGDDRIRIDDDGEVRVQSEGRNHDDNDDSDDDDKIEVSTFEVDDSRQLNEDDDIDDRDEDGLDDSDEADDYEDDQDSEDSGDDDNEYEYDEDEDEDDEEDDEYEYEDEDEDD